MFQITFADTFHGGSGAQSFLDKVRAFDAGSGSAFRRANKRGAKNLQPAIVAAGDARRGWVALSGRFASDVCHRPERNRGRREGSKGGWGERESKVWAHRLRRSPWLC